MTLGLVAARCTILIEVVAIGAAAAAAATAAARQT